MSTLYVLLLFVAVLGAWMGFNYWRLRRAAKVVENHDFAKKIYSGQLIDLREPTEYRKKHIMGARNIPYQQLKQSLAALRKDKPVLLYENDRGQFVTQAALYLKKQGFNDIYILSYGLNSWDGKVKTN
ncbi:rhodanese-like domain-containing protein [Streptococcus sp. zg-86]|uniref:Rhodanese-like domain-containing protein n=1 Tax=Streptococcus zhangguiae TaxID=2664091 RepID=A0A6I4RF43_9STRE|nr:MULTISPECIES: rhodanese-like domain-containing protein [unclassified Streptococcus]MTB64473.1 rhodanese-like domain-containing protein [Streptococcus sp. zg-86]MTB90837.1 rhodanese-like domain-containing protein [Streptococcus sp. zg-36]MWV56460.1 rhodanese-like domain-containing protein [Streptococcus sp. zg-70]QTH47333.1 rhodanese-like domain-containing protein [Streptococcus sp. zg-86]